MNRAAHGARCRGEHKTPELLRLNPRGLVPIMEDGYGLVHCLPTAGRADAALRRDVAMYESLAILDYLERFYPEARCAAAIVAAPPSTRSRARPSL